MINVKNKVHKFIGDVVAHLKPQKIHRFVIYVCNVLFHHYSATASSILLSTVAEFIHESIVFCSACTMS